MIEDWEIRDLQSRIEKLEAEAGATRSILAASIYLLLEVLSPEHIKLRFVRICEEAYARCETDDERQALKKLIQWEGEPVGWRKRSILPFG